MPPSDSPASIPLVHYALRVETRTSSIAEAAVFDEDSWRVRRIEYDEGLSQPYRLRLELLSEELELSIDALLGAEVELRCGREQGERRIHGIVRRARYLGTYSHRLHLRLEVGPALSLLGLTRRTRIFQAKTVPEIVQELASELLSKLGRKVDLSRLGGVHRRRDYCVQFKETDLGFFERILAEEGIAYVFEEDEGGRETLVLIDGNEAFSSVGEMSGEESVAASSIIPLISGGAEHTVESIGHFEHWRGDRTADVEISAWDWKASQPLRLVTREAKEPREPWDHGEDYTHAEGRLAEEDDGNGPHVDPTATLVRQAAERLETRAQLGTGGGDVLSFSAGRTFELSGHPHESYDGEYLLTRVSHRADCPEVDPHQSGALAGPNYENSFECTPRRLPWRPRVPRKPRISGHQIATVVGPKGEEIHTDSHGRIKVWMHWDREASERIPDCSCWLRVAQPWAGPGWGTMFIPRVGMEVLVSFVDGDPDRPLCVGTLYNGENRPPYALPDEKTKSTIRSSSSPGGEGHNELTFEDAAGQEELFLHAQRNLREVVRAAHSTSVGASQTLGVGKDQTITVGADRQVSVRGNQTVIVEGEGEDPSFSGHKMQVSGDHVVEVSKNASLSAPESISLVCKGTKIVLTPERVTIAAGGGAAVVLDVEALLSSAKLAKVKLDQTGAVRVSSNSPSTMTLDSMVKFVSSAKSELVLDEGAKLSASAEGAKLTLDGNAALVGEEVTCQAKAATLVMNTNATLSANTSTVVGAGGQFEAGPQGATTTGASVTTQAMGVATVSGKLVKIN